MKRLYDVLAGCKKEEEVKSEFCNAERMARQRLVLPRAADGKPDYAFMRRFMMSAEAKLRRRYAEARLKGL